MQLPENIQGIIYTYYENYQLSIILYDRADYEQNRPTSTTREADFESSQRDRKRVFRRGLFPVFFRQNEQDANGSSPSR